jgi:hypothetical protein
MKRLLSVAVSIFSIGVVGPLSGATITVDTLDPSVASDGWCSLIEAIENANADAEVHADCPAGVGADVIELGLGLTYTLDAVHNTTDGPNGLPVITSDITINGHDSTVKRQLASPAFRILYIDSSAVFSANDLIVRNGDVGSSFDGGAIHNRGTTVLNRCEVRDSNAYRGGGLANWAVGGDATMTLQSTGIEGNTARYGGGIYSRTSSGRNATLEVLGCWIRHNDAGPYTDAHGGGIHQSSSDGPTNATSIVTVVGSEISHNTAGGHGAGGISCMGDLDSGLLSELLIRGSIVSHNQSRAGAGVYANESRATIEDSVIEYNQTVGLSPGAILVLRGADLKLVRSTVSDNTVEGNDPGLAGYGGGLGIVDATAWISNSTISGNTALGPGPAPEGMAGGIGVGSSSQFGGLGATVVIEHSTITDNTAHTVGGGIGGIRISGSGNVEVVLNNTIVADNHEQGGAILGNCHMYAPTFVTSEGFNLADDTTCDLIHADDLVVADAMLGPLGSHGGPTACHVPEESSPAVDTGDPSHMDETDQRGLRRPIDGDRDAIAICDRGSVEFGLIFMDGFEFGDTSAWPPGRMPPGAPTD